MPGPKSGWRGPPEKRREQGRLRFLSLLENGDPEKGIGGRLSPPQDFGGNYPERADESGLPFPGGHSAILRARASARFSDGPGAGRSGIPAGSGLSFKIWLFESQAKASLVWQRDKPRSARPQFEEHHPAPEGLSGIFNGGPTILIFCPKGKFCPA
ncbi:hypothetical protein B4135_2766 [Caldibacillus debilis]|uniref:Uncharacterized protein n=1 Tax=Caldibacillus debilis TaxID=301148 RepID=A0A150LQL3_9BACI|nr:hypothetical protein B4135_2766 [Caldibacillus debilis]